MKSKANRIAEVKQDCYLHTKYTGDEYMGLCDSCLAKVRAIEVGDSK